MLSSFWLGRSRAGLVFWQCPYKKPTCLLFLSSVQKCYLPPCAGLAYKETEARSGKEITQHHSQEQSPDPNSSSWVPHRKIPFPWAWAVYLVCWSLVASLCGSSFSWQQPLQPSISLEGSKKYQCQNVYNWCQWLWKKPRHKLSSVLTNTASSKYLVARE